MVVIVSTSARAKSYVPEVKDTLDPEARILIAALATTPADEHRGNVKQTAAEKHRREEPVFEVPQTVTNNTHEPQESDSGKRPQVHGKRQRLRVSSNFRGCYGGNRSDIAPNQDLAADQQKRKQDARYGSGAGCPDTLTDRFMFLGHSSAPAGLCSCTAILGISICTLVLVNSNAPSRNRSITRPFLPIWTSRRFRVLI